MLTVQRRVGLLSIYLSFSVILAVHECNMNENNFVIYKRRSVIPRIIKIMQRLNLKVLNSRKYEKVAHMIIQNKNERKGEKKVGPDMKFPTSISKYLS